MQWAGKGGDPAGWPTNQTHGGLSSTPPHEPAGSHSQPIALPVPPGPNRILDPQTQRQQKLTFTPPGGATPALVLLPRHRVRRPPIHQWALLDLHAKPEPEGQRPDGDGGA